MPVSIARRGDLPALLAGVRGSEGAPSPRTGAAAEIHDLLKQRGALFFDEIVNTTRRLRSDVERGLRELVAWGLVTADGFQGLRQLLGKTAHTGRSSRARGTSAYSAGGVFTGSGPAGRWALVHAPVTSDADTDDLAEAVARVLLQRYGVVFRDLYQRESFTMPWRDVLRALRRLEARGVVRGGRFVSGFQGEQYASPEAVDSLRWVRRHDRTGERVTLSALDPVNLAGVVTPGAKVAAQPGKYLVFVDGLPQELPTTATEKTPVPSKLSPQLPARVR
jgi:ATP-dependent Lhr-like helicase